MPLFPITPLSPDLTLIKPIGSSETGLGSIPNVADGIPGIGGIGSVELPGVGVIKPEGFPQLPSLSSAATVSSPVSSPTAISAPEVTPFPTSTPVATSTPSAVQAPTPTEEPAPISTPVPAAGQLQQPGQGSPYTTQPITTDQIPDVIQTPVTPSLGTQSNIPVNNTPLAETFGKYLQDAVSNYNDVQGQADNMIQRLATGDKVDIHDVSLALQKASITSQLAIQVRDRLVEAYQEVMRMQM